MSVLFVLSNIAVPFFILAYTSLVQVHQNETFFSAKWLILILYTWVSNIFYYLLSDSGIFLILDLVFKLGIVFIPEAINQSLQKMVQALNLQLLINKLRGYSIKYFSLCLSSVLLYTLNRMTNDEQSYLKNVIMHTFQNINNTSAAPILDIKTTKPQKKTNNIGIGCDLLTIAMLNQEKRQTQILKIKLANQAKIQKSLAQNAFQATSSDIKKSKAQQGSENFGSMKKKSTFSIQKSSTDIGIIQEDDVDLNNLRKRQVHKQKIVDNRKQFKSPETKPIVKQDSEPSMILNKLDVSEYSDMFQDQQQGEAEKLVAKVETIIEIAGINTARLQIYNIQLYENNQIRIVSLYGRQFERHRLISMKSLKHGYYELKLEGGKVQSRKVKFRGSFQPFLKYMEA